MCDIYCLILLMICFLIVEGKEITTANTLDRYWSQWYDEDTPRNGVGDTETIEAIKQKGAEVCGDHYTATHTQCRTHKLKDQLVFDKQDTELAPDKLHNPCTLTRLECRNADQPIETTCRNYQVRFYCVFHGGQDIITKDNTTLIVLVAGLLFLFPMILALIITICRRHCCVKPQYDRLLINSDDMYNLDDDQQALFDPPPSYNLLFGHSQTSSSSEHLLVNAANTAETISSQGDPEQISIHTLPSSNSISMDSVTLTEADNCYRQFRDRVKRFPGMHLSVIDMYHQYYDSTTTPPPSYNDALVILATVPQETEASSENDRKEEEK